MVPSKVRSRARLVAAAWVKARRVSKRLERLAESYWELRYDLGQLGSRLAKVEPDERATPAIEQRPHPTFGAAGTQFVPLAALRRHDLNR